MAAARLISGLILAGVLCATTLQRLSLDEMVRDSTSIVRAKAAVAGASQHGSLIYTAYRLTILETLKGKQVATMDVVVPGGRVGGLRQTIPGAPHLASGKEYVVFVWTSKQGVNHIIGLSQGLFDVVKDAKGNLTLKRSATDARMLDGAGRVVRDEALTVDMNALLRKVRGSVAQ